MNLYELACFARNEKERGIVGRFSIDPSFRHLILTYSGCDFQIQVMGLSSKKGPGKMNLEYHLTNIGMGLRGELYDQSRLKHKQTFRISLVFLDHKQEGVFRLFFLPRSKKPRVRSIRTSNKKRARTTK